MKNLHPHLIALALAAATVPMAAQTKTSTTPQTVAHRPAVSRSAGTSACPTAPVGLSPKIPALPVGSPRCPIVAYSLTYIDTDPGTGEPAAQKKWYTVHYTGYLPDGTIFDSSRSRDPLIFPYGARRVITAWDTGFDGMRVGGKRRLFVPYQLGYGPFGKPGVIPEKSMLIFDIELLSQSDTPPAAAAQKAPVVVPSPKAPATTPPPPPSPAGTSAPPPVSSQTPATAPSTTTPKP